MGSWGQACEVGKAWRDNETALGAGTAVAGLGAVRAGAEVEHRTRVGVREANARVGTLVDTSRAAHANADARKGKRAEPIRSSLKPGAAVTNHSQTTAMQRDWAKEVDRGVAAAHRRAGALTRVAGGRIKTAQRIKGVGLGLAALGAAGTVKGMADTNRRRAMEY